MRWCCLRVLPRFDAREFGNDGGWEAREGVLDREAKVLSRRLLVGSDLVEKVVE